MKYKDFEDYLKDQFGKIYMGLDDDMSDAYEHWISNLDTSAVIELADKYGNVAYQNGFEDGSNNGPRS
jgi:hypothetical protein